MKSKVIGPVANGRDDYEIDIPDRRQDYGPILAEMRELLASGDSEKEQTWLEWMRVLICADLYALTLFSTAGVSIDPYYNRPYLDTDFLFHYSREIQFDSDDVIDTGARGSWKTTLKMFALAIQDLIHNPNETIAYFSFNLDNAKKHCDRVAMEIVINPIWTRVFPDIFGPRIEGQGRNRRPMGAIRWGSSDGYVIPGRMVASTSCSLEAYTFMDKIQPGHRIGIFMIDDPESESNVGTQEQVEKARDHFQSMQRLRGVGAKRRMNGTFHSLNGLLSWIVDTYATPGNIFRVRNYPVVDVSKPAPKIPEIDPSTGKVLPEVVQNQNIEGEPLFLHPVEIAKYRAEAEVAGGLTKYYWHYFGLREGFALKRFEVSRLQFYDELPEEIGRNMMIVICVDPSKGVVDPSYIWVWGVTWDRRYYWLDAMRRKLEPAGRKEAIKNMVLKWTHLSTVDQIRIENFGSQSHDEEMRYYLENELVTDFGLVVGVTFSRSAVDNEFSELSDGGKKVRAWNHWHTPLQEGRLYFPKQMTKEVDGGKFEDMVKRFLDNEFTSFPDRMKEDDGLDAGGLLFVVRKNIPAVSLAPRPETRMPKYYGIPEASWRSA